MRKAHAGQGRTIANRRASVTAVERPTGIRLSVVPWRRPLPSESSPPPAACRTGSCIVARAGSHVTLPARPGRSPHADDDPGAPGALVRCRRGDRTGGPGRTPLPWHQGRQAPYCEEENRRTPVAAEAIPASTVGELPGEGRGECASAESTAEGTPPGRPIRIRQRYPVDFARAFRCGPHAGRMAARLLGWRWVRRAGERRRY